MVFDCEVEVPEGTNVIPKYHTFQPPPDIPVGYYAIMSGGWNIVKGEKPIYPPPIPEPSPEEIAARIMIDISNKTQLRLDNFAKTRKYDGILSAATYANSGNPKFRIEGQYCVDIRDSTWATLYQILADVMGALRPMPSGYDEIEPELPVLVWPN
jgi:hypothetical protein